MTSTWITYNDLAWTEELLATPEDNREEAGRFMEIIQQASTKPLRTMLHLGCGAGGYDHFFKQHFDIVGVDLSRGMLDLARTDHPEIEYHEGDMRTIRLDRRFDIVAIPDSIDYMVTGEDLRQAIETSVAHLAPEGLLLIAAETAEIFQNNNFAYEGAQDDIQVTLLENNHINAYRPNTYEATFVYLIRNKGVLTTHTETQTLGLFPLNTWKELFREAGLHMREVQLDGFYDSNILGEVDYPMIAFVGQRA